MRLYYINHINRSNVGFNCPANEFGPISFNVNENTNEDGVCMCGFMPVFKSMKSAEGALANYPFKVAKHCEIESFETNQPKPGRKGTDA